jgi:single-strand DNA-binding protein
MGVNKVILVGNLGRDAEVSVTTSGQPVAKFTMATTRRYKSAKSETWEEKTEWHRIVLWGRQAETLRDYLRKGKQIYLEGRIETRSWDDKDGQKRYTTEIIAETIQLLGSAGGGGGRSGGREDESGGGGGGYDRGSDTGGGPGPADDDIPF